MTDRRRVNGPPGGTSAPTFATSTSGVAKLPNRKRKANELRRIFLKTGLVPSAAGSAYYELESQSGTDPDTLVSQSSTVKLSCTVHGPKPLPRTASFSPNLQLSAHVKIAPFATRSRRGYIRDAGERDLSVHLQTALRAVVLADRYPKSALDVTVTVLEAEEDLLVQSDDRTIEGCAAMNLLAGCITVSSAALADARIDCLDLMAGGVAIKSVGQKEAILDPSPAEHGDIESACVVGYLPNRDEITELWMKGDLPAAPMDGQFGVDNLIDAAVGCARGTQLVLEEAIKESTEQYLQSLTMAGKATEPQLSERNDIEMKT